MNQAAKHVFCRLFSSENGLKDDVATYDFYIQQFVNDAVTPIEDAGIEWKESDSPFIKIAQITVPKQIFNTTDRFELA